MFPFHSLMCVLLMMFVFCFCPHDDEHIYIYRGAMMTFDSIRWGKQAHPFLCFPFSFSGDLNLPVGAIIIPDFYSCAKRTVYTV